MLLSNTVMARNTLVFANLMGTKNNCKIAGYPGLGGFYFVPCPGSEVCFGMSFLVTGDYAGFSIYADETVIEEPKILLDQIMMAYHKAVDHIKNSSSTNSLSTLVE